MATASIVQLWYRMMGLAKAGTSGMDNQFAFNGRMDSVQKSLTELLIEVAEENQGITDALNWLKKSSGNLTSDGDGSITFPDDYLHIDSLSYVTGGSKWPATKLRTAEVDMTSSSPIRNSNFANNELNYYFIGGTLYVSPEVEDVVVNMRYYKQVPAAEIVLTPTSDDTGDYVTPTVGTELGWPVNMFNLLLFMMLEQYSIEVKENLLLEYAEMGISREMVRTKMSDFQGYDRRKV